MGPINPEHVDFAAAAIKAGALSGSEIQMNLHLAKLLNVSPDVVQDALVDAKQAMRMAMQKVATQVEGHIGRPPSFIGQQVEAEEPSRHSRENVIWRDDLTKQLERPKDDPDR